VADLLPAAGDFRSRVLEYVIEVYDIDMEGLVAALRKGGHSGMEALVGSIAEGLLEKGKAEIEAWFDAATDALDLASIFGGGRRH